MRVCKKNPFFLPVISLFLFFLFLFVLEQAIIWITPKPVKKDASTSGSVLATTVSNIVDYFTRNDQTYWGYGWSGEASINPLYAIYNNRGIVHGGNPEEMFSTIGGIASETQCNFYADLSTLPQGSYVGVVARYVDRNNWYKAYADREQIIVEQNRNGTKTRLNASQIPLNLQGSITGLRLMIQGGKIYLKGWSGSDPNSAPPYNEPINWTAIFTDTNPGAPGYCGIDVFLPTPGSEIKLLRYQAYDYNAVTISATQYPTYAAPTSLPSPTSTPKTTSPSLTPTFTPSPTPRYNIIYPPTSAPIPSPITQYVSPVPSRAPTAYSYPTNPPQGYISPTTYNRYRSSSSPTLPPTSPTAREILITSIPVTAAISAVPFPTYAPAEVKPLIVPSSEKVTATKKPDYAFLNLNRNSMISGVFKVNVRGDLDTTVDLMLQPVNGTSDSLLLGRRELGAGNIAEITWDTTLTPNGEYNVYALISKMGNSEIVGPIQIMVNNPLADNAIDANTISLPSKFNPQTVPVDKKIAISKLENTKAPGSNEAGLTFRGKAKPNSIIVILIYSNPIAVTVRTDANGVWSYTLEKPLPPGKHQTYVVLNDKGKEVRSEVKEFFIRPAYAGSTDESLVLESVDNNSNLIDYAVITLVIVFSAIISLVLVFLLKNKFGLFKIEG